MDKTDIVNKYCRKLIEKRTRLWDDMGHYYLNYSFYELNTSKFNNFIEKKNENYYRYRNINY